MSSIKKIVIEVSGNELSLSLEDAKALQRALNELFPLKPVAIAPRWDDFVRTDSFELFKGHYTAVAPILPKDALQSIAERGKRFLSGTE
jgi:hypothetical protein